MTVARYKNCQLIWIWNLLLTKVNTNHCCPNVMRLAPSSFKTQSVFFQFLCYSTVITSAVLTSRWMNSIRFPALHIGMLISTNVTICYLSSVCVHYLKSYEYPIVPDLTDWWNNGLMLSCSQQINQFSLNIWRKVWKTGFPETKLKFSLIGGSHTITVPEISWIGITGQWLLVTLKGQFCWA